MISCFETVELRDGLYFELDAHLSLLRTALSTLGLPPLDEPQLSRALELARSHPPEPEGVDSLRRVRVSWDDRGEPIVVASPMLVHTTPAAVFVDPEPRLLSTASWAGLKTTSYRSATAYSSEHPASDEVLMVNELRSICGGGYSNLFTVVRGSLITPRVGSGSRAGVTRSLIIEGLRDAGVEVFEGTLSVDDVLNADEAFLTSTGRHVQAIGSINGNCYPPERPVTEIAARTFNQIYNESFRWS